MRDALVFLAIAAGLALFHLNIRRSEHFVARQPQLYATALLAGLSLVLAVWFAIGAAVG